jgi:hypothetical protein
MKKIFLLIAILIGSSTFIVFAQQKNFPVIKIPPTEKDVIPPGWFKAGDNTQDYIVGIDENVSVKGKTSASIASTVIKPQGFCTLMQVVDASGYRGQRVEFSGYVKAQLVSGWAGMWMRAEDKNQKPLSFDNMENRQIVGTSDWIKYSIVLDIPYSTDEISFGVSLHGKGKIWFDDFSIEQVGNSVPVTDMMKSSNYEPKPSPLNLDFEQKK